MIPTNINNRVGCKVISSACVIWQGGTFECIQICNGDTLQDVLTKGINEICAIREELNPLNYNLSCFNFGNCPPQTFHALFQYVLDQICTILGHLNLEPGDTSGMLDNIFIPLPPCLQFTDDFGTPVTQIILYDPQTHNDYLTYLGAQICEIQTQISSINNSVQTLFSYYQSLINQVVNIQQGIFIPDITLMCGFNDLTMYPTTATKLVAVVERLETFIGKISTLYDGYSATPCDHNNMLVLSSFDSLYNLFTANINSVCSQNPISLSQQKNIIAALTNLWRYIFDIRNYINNNLCNVCVCSDLLGYLYLHYEFVNPTTLAIKMSGATGIPSYSLSDINVSIVCGDNLIQHAHNTQLPYYFVDNNMGTYPFFEVFVTACVSFNTRTCNYMGSIFVSNPSYGCKYNYVSGVLVLNYNLVVP